MITKETVYEKLILNYQKPFQIEEIENISCKFYIYVGTYINNKDLINDFCKQNKVFLGQNAKIHFNQSTNRVNSYLKLFKSDEELLQFIEKLKLLRENMQDLHKDKVVIFVESGNGYWMF